MKKKGSARPKRITRRTPRGGRKGIGMPTGLIGSSTKHGNATRKNTYKP